MQSMSQKGQISLQAGNKGLDSGEHFALERQRQVQLWGGGRGQSWLRVTHCGSFGSFGASRSL